MIELKKVTKLQTISKILHIADVHIRNLRRHTEYSIQFEKLYASIKDNLDEATLIYVGGDIVHTKTDMSPELISMTSKFLSSLADLAPTIVIAGNHDANLNNPDRLDAISPIIENLNHKNLFYLKDTGLYIIGDIIFSVMSVFDEPDKYILASDIASDLCKIALYHGPVTTSMTSIGFNVHGSVDMNIFDGYDYALLGDIHMHQYLNTAETIAYASSLIQQNFGESYDSHGYIIWDIINKRNEFIHIDNDYGFHTLTILNGELLPYPTDLITSKSRVRVKTVSTSDLVSREIISKLKSDLNISDVAIVKLDTITHGNPIDLSNSNNIDIRNIDVQNNLIKEYLNSTLNLDLDQESLDKIFDINRKTNLLLNTADEVIRNIIWKPKKFEFSNMFSYGANNVINFSSLSGIQGLFGPNASGKSSLLDALCFCLFDTTSRAYKAEQILNTKTNNFTCKLNFAIDDIDYFVEKTGTKNHKGKVKVNIDFWSVDTNGNKTILNGEDRRKTSAIIRSYIGTYEDFTLMCLSLQNNNTNFVDKSQTDRKEILAKFLDLNILDSLYELANIEYKRLDILINDIHSVSLESKIDDLTIKKQTALNMCTELSADITKQKTEILNINAIIYALSMDIKPILTLDKNVLEDELIKYQTKSQELYNALDVITASQERINANIVVCNDQLSMFDEETIKSELRTYETAISDIGKLNIELDKLRLKLSGKQDKLLQLEKHEYDPNCEYCVNNIFVKDAILTKSEIASDLDEITLLQAQLDIATTTKNNLEYSVTAVENISDIQSRITANIANISRLEIEKLGTENSILKCNTAISEIESYIIQYNENENSIIKNVELERLIKLEKEKLKIQEDLLSEYTANYTTFFAAEKLADNELLQATELLNKIKQLIRERAAYSYYLSSIGKDGISYQLITKVIPRIENEINTILSNLVDFSVLLYADGKNVDAYMVYGKDHWPLELSSGMERFISSIAIRVALINISSLPKPTFFAIDEGLGVLDSSNLNQMYLLFNYIRDVFQFTLIISHIDIVKDMVDIALTVEVENGFSKLEIL